MTERASRVRIHVRPRLRGPAARLFPNWLAITIGRDIVTWRPLDGPELEHELEHARQWAAHGWRFPLRYWSSSLRVWRSGGDWYRDNAFEVTARAAAENRADSP
ncbi:hypothetical protein BH20CHL6_BH20CHL6_01850 [soil metagenome]